MEIEGEYFGKVPCHQNAVGLFAGEWASVFPESAKVDSGGFAEVFSDERIAWAGEFLNGFEGKSVLELGPLEGAHSSMMEERGADSILGIEVNPRAYLKCLVTKEIMALSRTRFLLGDFVELLKQGRRYDLCFACGVFYHLRDPIRLIERLGSVCDELFIWTHVFEENQIAGNSSVAKHFSGKEVIEWGGQEFNYHKYCYESAVGSAFLGGESSGSCWMTKEELIRALEDVGGYEILKTKDECHANGPALWLVARKRLATDL